MQKELKDRWVAALRSGVYKQGRETLRRLEDDGTVSYCCLGVLADVAKPEIFGSGWGDRWDRLGLDGDLAIELAQLNDRGEDFATIAREIERRVDA